ncbi:hypothetical protein D3C86_1665450 [compost metagenome]
MLKSIPAFPNNVKNICATRANVNKNNDSKPQSAAKPLSTCPPKETTMTALISPTTIAAITVIPMRAAIFCIGDNDAPSTFVVTLKFIPIIIVPTMEASTSIIGSI